MYKGKVNILVIRPVTLNWVLLLCLIVLASLTYQKAVGQLRTTPNLQQEKWKASVASVVITLEQSMWMAGYAARTKPSEGKVNDLYAKALAIEDAQGNRLVIVTVDLLGIPRYLRDWLEIQVNERYKLPPEGLLLNASHTHCGPAIMETDYSIYGSASRYWYREVSKKKGLMYGTQSLVRCRFCCFQQPSGIRMWPDNGCRPKFCVPFANIMRYYQISRKV